MLTPQPTRCLRTRSFSLRAGIANADAYAGLRTPGSPGFCLREVLLLLKMNKGGLGRGSPAFSCNVFGVFF